MDLLSLTVDVLISLQQPPGSPHHLQAWTRSIAAEQAAALACIRPIAELRQYTATPLLFVRVGVAEVDRIRECPGVLAVSPNRLFHRTLTESIPLIGADTVHSTLGYTGAGTAIAIIDTGITYTQAEVGGCFGSGCKVVYGYDFGDNDADPTECHGHGTNVAAIAAGTAGVAPDADIVAYKVFESADCESASDAGIAAAIDDVVLQAATYNIVAVNLSLGTYDYRTSSACDSSGTATETAVATAYKADITMIAAAGNDGDEDNVSFPACLRKVFAIANTYDAAASSTSWCTTTSCSAYCTDSSPAVDTLNCSSNGGDLIDLAAPGTTITAGGQSMSGTSQASPHVAGAVALLKEAVPGAGPKEMEDWLLRSDTVVTDARGTTTYEYPRLELETVFEGSVADLKITDVDLETTGGLFAGTVATLAVTVENSGPGDVELVDVVLSSADSGFLLDGAAMSFGTAIMGGETTLGGFPFEVDDACIENHNADITVTLQVAGVDGDDETATFSLRCFADDDADGVEHREDCDDTDPNVFPGADELCNDVDDDCDGEIDGSNVLDAAAWYRDADGDDYGSPGDMVTDCAPPEGYIEDPGDCNDADAAIHPDADEHCGAYIDADCDGVMMNDPVDAVDGWTDADADGHGVGDPIASCDLAADLLAATGDDCDDNNPDLYPGAPDYDDECVAEEADDPGGCGCAAGGAGGAGAGALAALGVLFRRRRDPGGPPLGQGPGLSGSP